jgi:hypothetical protein
MADHSEFTYASRHTALGEFEPTTLDELLPEGAEVVRRAFFTSAKKQELVVAYEETLVAMSVESSFLWFAVAARDAKHAAYVKDALLDAFPEGEDIPAGEAKVPLVVWSAGRAMLQGGGRINALKVHPWQEIRPDYAPETGAALAGLFDGFEPGERRPAVVARRPRHGEVARARGARARVALVVRDPLRGRPRGPARDSDYLLSVTLHPVMRPCAWKLVILEDTGELLTADASARTGHALSRLLNVTDGMLGQGSNTLFLITTNEPLQSFHEAVARPGRCASQVEFLPLSAAQGTERLRSHGAPQHPPLSGPAALADLYAMLAGDEVAPARRRGPVGFAPREVA